MQHVTDIVSVWQ